ncbi:hypothetical protein [Stenotrophomonas sp. ATs4]|uniref:hypothetical protein n=1 Tax=Stenotrophomonas sp. ATs4 TaxID=3402766 RepID=UPI003F6EAD72
MKGWKTNDYFSWKSWSRIQEERRDEELAKNSASPLPMMALAALLLIGAVAGLLFVLASVLH